MQPSASEYINSTAIPDQVCECVLISEPPYRRMKSSLSDVEGTWMAEFSLKNVMCGQDQIRSGCGKRDTPMEVKG